MTKQYCIKCSHHHLLLFDSQAGKPLRGISSDEEEESLKDIVSHLKTEVSAQSLEIKELKKQMMQCHRKLAPPDHANHGGMGDLQAQVTANAKAINTLNDTTLEEMAMIETHDAMIQTLNNTTQTEMEMITDLNSTTENLENQVHKNAAGIAANDQEIVANAAGISTNAAQVNANLKEIDSLMSCKYIIFICSQSKKLQKVSLVLFFRG